MKIRTIRSILLACFFTFLVTSGDLVDAAEKNQMTMQEMTKRFEEMEKRVVALEDIEAIKRLQTEYVDCLQKGNYDTIEYLFTEDALFMKNQGREAIGKYYREEMADIHKGQEGDLLCQPIIDLIDVDTAKAKWVIYFFYYHPVTYQILYFTHRWMDMDYKKVDGKWLISRLGIIGNIEPPGGPPSEERFLSFLEEAQKTMQEMRK